jgi:hypothetical protein
MVWIPPKVGYEGLVSYPGLVGVHQRSNKIIPDYYNKFPLYKYK